jgi:acyl-CoA synthetase (AMP-forming)/AMP-acid ligase II
MSVPVELSKQLVLGEVLARQARNSPQKEALVFKNKRYTYGQFNERVNRVANGLIALGIGKGDKVALLFLNCTEIVECLFATHKVGAVVVPLNFRLVPKELAYQVDNSDARALIFSETFQESVSAIRLELGKVEHYICVGAKGMEGAIDYEEFLAKYSADEPSVLVDDDDPAYIMYTAGTTGRSKGAVLTHKNVLMGAAINQCIERPTPDPDRQLVVFPLSHGAGAQLAFCCVFRGGSNIILDVPTPENILRLIQEEKITNVGLVPAIWNWLVNEPKLKDFDLSSLQMAGTTAAPMPLELKNKLLETFPNVKIYEGFGQTETSATVMAKPEDMFRKHGSVGRRIINVEVRIVDDDDKDVPVGEVGEIVYRGPSVMKEYYKNPEATAEAFKGGWFHSGDLVRQDDEGYIYVVDRKKDMIISGGHNIYPAELEEVLYTHPKILEAAVIGVPDPEWGESVKAIVVPKAGETLTEAEVIEYCKQNLASYKKPKSVELVGELPRNVTGKVLKRELREKYGKAG